jgi:membrane protease YdiL (CAAX protease family)
METQVTPAVTGPGDRPPEASLLARIHPLAFALLSLGLVFVLYQIIGGGITFLLLGGTIDQSNVDVVRWATLLSQLLFILVPTLILGRLRFGSFREAFPLRFPRLSELLVSIVAVFALQQVLQVYMMAQDALPLPEVLRKFVEMLKEVFEQTYRVLVSARSPGEFLAVVLTVAVVPALAEEFFFRGLVQKTFSQAAGGMQAAILAGIVFGLYHLNPLNVVPLIMLGVYFGFLVYRTGSLTLALVAHFFNNFLACTAAYLQIDEEFLALAPGSVPSIPILAVTVVVFGVVFLGANAYLIWITRTDDRSMASR